MKESSIREIQVNLVNSIKEKMSMREMMIPYKTCTCFLNRQTSLRLYATTLLRSFPSWNAIWGCRSSQKHQLQKSAKIEI